MANLLKGKEVADAINLETTNLVSSLKEKGISPKLAIVRVGERKDDLAYERTACKRCEALGIEETTIVLEEKCTEEDIESVINELNNDSKIHGVLLFRPLPKHLDEKKICSMINPLKDIDGISNTSLVGVFKNEELGFTPCTAEAAMRILNYYNIDLTGKKVTVIGRSLVVGRPLAMLLMHANATVTICHTKTKDIESIAKNADILVVASGQMESINSSYVNPNQVIIDVGISWNDTKQKLCGDVNFDEVEPIVESITPVPGGVGSVTTSVLLNHLVKGASRCKG